MVDDHRPTMLLRKTWYEKRLLSLPHHSHRAVPDRHFVDPHEMGRHICLNRTQPHPFFDGIIQRKIDEIDLDDSRQTVGQILNQLIQVLVHGDSWRDLQPMYGLWMNATQEKDVVNPTGE